MAYLSLGSNIGDRLDYLTQATKLLDEHPDIAVVKISSVYETAAWGLEDQADFYNIALEIETALSPIDLLEVCQKIELELERTRIRHWGPRTIDIDILLYNDVEIREEFLTIPHPYMLERAFVTIPLHEIAPKMMIVGIKLSDIVKEYTELEDKCLETEYKIEV